MTGAGAAAGERVLRTSHLQVANSPLSLPRSDSQVAITLPSCPTYSGLACLTLLVVEGVSLMSLSHSLQSTLPFSLDYFFRLVLARPRTVIHLDIIFKSKHCTMAEERWTA